MSTRQTKILNWSKKAPGIWSSIIGSPEAFTPFSAINVKPALQALKKRENTPFPFNPDSIKVDIISSRIIIRLPLKEDEKIFGFGLQFMRINHRGRTRYLRVNSDPKIDTGETHAPVPFYVSSRNYGVLINTSRIVTIYCGSCVRKDSKYSSIIRDRNTDPLWMATPISDSVEIMIPGNGVEIFIFSGNTVLDVVERYNLYCGGGALPPRWGLGFWYRMPTNFNAEQIIREAEELRKRDFPCDVIGLEPGWHSKSYPTSYEWSKERFPQPAEFIDKLRSKGFRVNLWENPYVSPSSKIYPKLKPLSGSHTVWGGIVPDYSLPEAREILKAQHTREHISLGVSGYKLDECDGSELTDNSWIFPAHATFPSGHDGEQMRQVYGLILQKMITDIFHERNIRTYGLVRASTAGASSLPYVLYSDLYDHRQFVRALCNSSFSGLLWTPEVREAKSSEEWVRRIQVACFSPLAMLNAWSSQMKPWSFPEVEPIVRKYIKLRMQLIPYFYSAFARYHFDGTPPFRAMALEDDLSKTDAAEIDDQYMAGDSILVAPLFGNERAREVFLPEGIWYDFETGERFRGGQVIQVSAGLEKIPLFVRNGGIIPMMPALSHVPQAGEPVPLEIRHYGTVSGNFKLFDDDGESYAYEKGFYRWRILEVKVLPDGKKQGSISKVEDGWNSSYGRITWKFIE